MSKKSIGPQAHIPMVVSILGTTYEERPNFMALGWQCRANFQPPMLAVGVHSGHATHAGIVESGAFSVCFPHRGMMEETDLIGILSGEKWDKSEMFTVFKGKTGAPMIEQCPLCLECEVKNKVDMETNTLFIGEIMDAFADESALTEGGNPDLAKMDSLLLTMPDNRYWNVAGEIGKAWKVGRSLQVRLEAEGRLKPIE
jgi:flavin reductase (DIM6/NTAB) family NADH-FMN oxidoreductase RutF